MESWKCPYCDSRNNWFDRSITIGENGETYGMYTRCAECGKSKEEEEAIKQSLEVMDETIQEC